MGRYTYNRDLYNENGMSEILSKIDNPHEIMIGYTDDEVYTQDYTKISNLLVLGTTGSGKSAFIQSLIAELMSNATPYDAKFVIYDSKGIDYVYLNWNPFLYIPVVTETYRIHNIINWLITEAMERISDTFLSNKPHIFVIFDEFSKISRDPNNSELLNWLLQIDRSVKIHCILVSSTPSAQVISTELKANIPFKVSFRTATKHISRMVIDEAGAELLAFPGEMIYIGQEGKIKCNSVFGGARRNGTVDKRHIRELYCPSWNC